MYAVIETGGKQYRVAPGDVVQVEKLEGNEGSSLKFENVLFCSSGSQEAPQIWVGKPYLSGAAVEVEIVGQGRGDKITIVKMKRRKQYRRTKGHRQFYTQLLVTRVANGAGQELVLAGADKAAKLATFVSHLRPRGPTRVNPVLARAEKKALESKASPKAATGADNKSSEAAKKPAAAKKTMATTTPKKKA